MTQTSLDRQVARATGESVATIRRIGFQIACPPLVVFDREPNADRLDNPATVDCDELDAQRVSIRSGRYDRMAA